MYLSRFRPSANRSAEFLACLWQGDVPASLVLHRWLYVDSVPREMVILWDGDDDARDYVARAFGTFGDLHTEAVTDSTPGLAACFDRDLDAFGRWLAGRGSTEAEIAAQLDVRRRGLRAASQTDAAAAGRAWAAEQADR